MLRRAALAAAFGAALVMPLGACAEPAPQSAAAPAARRSAAMKFDGARAWTDLQRQVGFGPRPSGTPALAKTRQYILAQLKAAGIRAQEQTFTATTPAGPGAGWNIIGTIAGRRPERLVLASHYDTKRAPFKFVGANDGASSTAALLELGRALAGSQPAFSIELLFFDGEEAVNWDWAGTDNTYGSRYYVQAAQKAGTLGSIKALVLLDMIGDRDLLVRREAYSTPWLVDLIWSAAARLGHGATFINEPFAVEDDHLNFIRAGVPAADVIDLDNPTWHTAQDDLEHVSQKSLQLVGDVILAALPEIEKRVSR